MPVSNILLGLHKLRQFMSLMHSSAERIRKHIVSETTSILSGHIDASSLRKLKFLQIVNGLVGSKRVMSRRSVYYEAVPIFGSQSRVDGLVKHYTARFGCRQENLNIRSGSKGIFHGALVFHYRGLTKAVEGKGLIPDMDGVLEVGCRHKTVLVVEKETIFDRIAHGNRMVVCGKGYPCKNTMKLLKMLERQCKIVCLTDFDPYGLHIFLTYQKAVRGISRIGLSCADLFEYKVEECGRIKLSKYDLKMIETLKKSLVRDDALFIEGLGYKMELEAVFNRDTFEVDEYLRSRCPDIDANCSNWEPASLA